MLRHVRQQMKTYIPFFYVFESNRFYIQLPIQLINQELVDCFIPSTFCTEITLHFITLLLILNSYCLELYTVDL